MLRTFRSRFLLACLLTFAAMLALLQWSAQKRLTAALEQSLQLQGDLARPLLASAVAPLLAARDYASLEELVRLAVGPHGLAALEVLDARGERLAAAEAAAGDAGPEWTVPVVLEGQTYGSLRMRLDTRLVAESQQRLARDALAIGVIVLLAGIGLIALALGVLGQGAARLLNASRRIADGDLSVELPLTGAAEVRELSDAFNRMSQALQAQMQALRDGEQRLRSVVAALSEGLLVQDRTSRVVECNEAAARLIGASRAELLQSDSRHPIGVLRRPDGYVLAGNERPFWHAMRSGRAQRHPLLQLERRDGTVAWIQINSEPILSAPGEAPTAVVSTLTDLTRHVQAEEALRQANQGLEQRVAERTAELRLAKEAAEQASQAKSQFLSRMSHELRTPLNAILGFTQLIAMRSEGLEPAQREQLRQVEAAGWHLLALIDEVLDLARVEAGATVVTLQPVVLADVAAQALQMAAPLATRHGVTIDAAPLDAALRVRADPKRLLQVLNNLLSNAIKYNRPQGRVELAVRQEAGQVEIAVVDTGQGLTAAQRAQLFQPFARLGAEDGAVEGTGIGLVITHRLVELMGGSIAVASEPGTGSRFTVTLPVDRAAMAAAAADVAST